MIEIIVLYSLSLQIFDNTLQISQKHKRLNINYLAVYFCAYLFIKNPFIVFV